MFASALFKEFGALTINKSESSGTFPEQYREETFLRIDRPHLFTPNKTLISIQQIR